MNAVGVAVWGGFDDAMRMLLSPKAMDDALLCLGFGIDSASPEPPVAG